MYIAFSSTTSGERGIATFLVMFFVGLHLLSTSSGLRLNFEPILDLPFNLYIKDVVVPAITILLAIMFGSEGLWAGTIYSTIVNAIALAMIIPGFLRF